MNEAFDHPWILLLLILAVPALLGRDAEWHAVPSLLALPVDRASRWLDILLRLLGFAAIAAIVVGLSGPHRRQHGVRHTARGAHIVLVLDRSLSMDEAFALQGHKAAESKSAASARLLDAFFARRPHDSFGIVGFSTAAIQILPITPHRDAVSAALSAMRQPALANTNIGGGLTQALAMLAQDDPEATRVILMVSDGAGYIAQSVQEEIRDQVLRQHVHLYYLYLRAGDDPPLAENMGGATDATHPAALDAFLRGLGVPYRSFEASDPGAIEAATSSIGALETRPLSYRETLPRLDYDRACYRLAIVCLALVLAARLAERDWAARPAAGLRS